MDNTRSQMNIWHRMWLYQSERFPVLAHGMMIAAFTFSAISFSRLSRGAEGFIRLDHFLVGFLTTFSLFFMMRVLDEIKDKKSDAQFRQHLPVPRGLVTIRELLIFGISISTLTLIMILVYYPKMLLLLVVVIIWLSLMTVEFFVPDFINERLILYATSHMIIIPLIDIYASGLDWYLAGESPHFGLIIFFGVSFFNGLVIEIGRKIKAPQDESVGVQSYTSLLGTDGGVALWVAVASITFSIATYAMLYADISSIYIVLLACFFIVLLVLAFSFYKNKTTKTAKRIELASGIWTLGMYLLIGGFPGLVDLFINR